MQCVEALAALSDFGDVLSHDADRVINLRLDRSGLGVPLAAAGGRAPGAAVAGEVRVVWLGPEAFRVNYGATRGERGA